MTLSTLHAIEWLDNNMHTSYPFVGGQHLSRSLQGLPASFVVDMHLVVPDSLVGVLAPTASLVRTGFYLHSIERLDAGYVVRMAHGNVIVAASGVIPLNLAIGAERDSDNGLAARTFALAPTNDYGISGSMVVGTCSDMHGPMEFDAGQVELLPSNALLVDMGLRSVTVGDRTLTSDFTIAAGPGIELSVSDTTDGPIVTVSSTAAHDMAYGSIDELVSAVLSALGDPIRRINGSGPDENGNIRIVEGDCTQIDTDASAGSIRISNPCSRPCCGSASQEQLESALVQLEAAQRRLSEYYQALTNNVNAVQARLASLIAAK